MPAGTIPPPHAASPDYELDAFVDDPTHPSKVVQYDAAEALPAQMVQDEVGEWRLIEQP